MSTDNRYISRRALLTELGISRQTLSRWTMGKGFPPPLKRSGLTPIYKRADIDAWFASDPIEEIIGGSSNDDRV